MPRKKKEEELEHVKSSNGSNEPGAGEQGAGEQGAGAPSGQSGGESGGEQGAQGGLESGGGGIESGGGGEQGGERESSKINLLQRIRAERANGLGNVGSGTNGASHGNSQGNEGGLLGNNGGVKDDNGSTPRTNRANRRGDKQATNSNGGSSQSTQTNERGNRVDNKPQGVDIKGVDKIKALAQRAAAVEPPKLRFQWDEKALTNKEGEEILPKIKALLEFSFKHMDKGISVSNRNRTEAHIWSHIDQEDIEIISSHLVEMGKGSKVVATAVRRMTNSYRLLQIGLITLPKFIQTFQFYQSNGGFALIGGK